MTPPPKPYRLVYRAFDRIEFDEAKSNEVLEGRGFDFGYVSRMFPAYVLERPDTRGYSEARFKVIGEVLGGVFVLIYTRRGPACRVITAWRAERAELEVWNDYLSR